MKNGMEKIEVVKWQEGINLKNLSRDTIFDSIQEIDKSVFHEDGLSDKQSDIDRYEAYKDSYIFALDESKIVGYLCYFPITEKFYNSVIEGIKVYDGDIAGQDICNLNDNSNYIFLLSVAILPKYQKKEISREFSKILIKEFSRIKISDMASYAFSTEGEHFLNVFGLKNYKDMEDGIKLMRMPFVAVKDKKGKIIFSRDINIPDEVFIGKIIEIDASVYPPDMQGTMESVLSRYRANTDSYILLTDDVGEIVGYLCCFPVKETLYREMLESDRIFDDEITADAIVPYNRGFHHHLFMISLVVKPCCRNGAAKLIAAALEDFFVDKREKGFLILSAAAYAVTDKGANFLTKSGFSRIKILERGYGFYVRKF